MRFAALLLHVTAVTAFVLPGRPRATPSLHSQPEQSHSQNSNDATSLKEYNARIAHLAKSGDAKGATELFRRAPFRDSYTYTAVFGAVDGPTAAKIAKTFPLDGKDATYVGNVALRKLKQESREAEALDLLGHFRPVADRLTLTTAIGCCAKSGNATVIFDLLNQVMDPDAQTYAAAISALKKDPRAALEVFRRAPVSKRNAHVYGALQTALVAEKELALEAYEKIPPHCQSPHAKSHMLKACGADVDLALKVLGGGPGNADIFREDGAEYHVSAVLACCEKNGQVGDVAVRLTQLLLKGCGRRGFKPTLESVNCAISALGSCGRASQALALFEWLESPKARAADPTSYSAAITACAHKSKPNWRKALSLLAASAEKFQTVGAHLLGPAIVACERGGAPRQAARLLRTARASKNAEIDVSLYNHAILAQRNDAATNWDTAISLFREIRRVSGLTPERRSYLHLIEVLVTAQQYGRADVVYAAARKRGVLDHRHAAEANAVDLHDHTRASATCALRAALREAADLLNDHDEFHVVVGRGRHSQDGETVLQPYVLSLVKNVFGLDAFLLPGNDGRVVVQVGGEKHSLADRALAAFWRATANQPLLLHPLLLLAAPPQPVIANDDDKDKKDDDDYDDIDFPLPAAAAIPVRLGGTSSGRKKHNNNNNNNHHRRQPPPRSHQPQPRPASRSS